MSFFKGGIQLMVGFPTTSERQVNLRTPAVYQAFSPLSNPAPNCCSGKSEQLRSSAEKSRGKDDGSKRVPKGRGHKRETSFGKRPALG